MTTHQPTQYSTTSGIWLWGLVGALGVIALLAAMAWVVQGQVEQGHILRAQWQTPARMAKVERYEVERYDVSGRSPVKQFKQFQQSHFERWHRGHVVRAPLNPCGSRGACLTGQFSLIGL